MSSEPIIGISMGDPAGVGPEIIVKAMARDDVRKLCRPVVVGQAASIARAVEFLQSQLKVNAISDVAKATFDEGVIDVYRAGSTEAAPALGVVSPEAGDLAFQAVKTVIDLAMARQVDASVTAPIHKEALLHAGHRFPGHTEIFAHFTKTADYTMMLAAGNFRVVHISTHVSLRQACDAVKRDRVRRVIGLANDACRRLGIEKPRIGVAGLNPHASDGGLFGTEEREHIIPAIKDAQSDGINADGPCPPDTFFAKAVSGFYDICVAMYHDQGHIPVKIRGFNFDVATNAWTSVRGINVSLGLPIIRTSVDHGTAFDQAGKGTASDESLLDAIEYAARMARNR
jgi:4-hydroxythreonine-4-phosphate dehydrogenase